MKDLELELSLKPTKIGDHVQDNAPQSYKDYMESRLQETLAEARRHHQSYMDIREQYNSFVEGRINQMIKNLETNKTPSKAVKLHQDVI